MNADEVYDQVAREIRRMDEEHRATARKLAELKEEVSALLQLLIARGTLAESHKKHLGHAARKAPDGKRQIFLRPYVDKYAIGPGEVIDCAARINLCHARCCTLAVELTTQDIEEGKVRWEINYPYMLRHDADEMCTHFDRKHGGCTVYEHRPAYCREYSCKNDPRIWSDFENYLPAPLGTVE